MNPSPFLSLKGICKSFRAVKANDQIDLDVCRGEVHALLGENGAGKSTLMKILYGFYRADSGEIRLEGKPVQIRSPHDARQLRIGMVFQDFIQVPALTVAENIALFLPDLPAVLDKSGISKRIKEISRRYGLEVDPRSLVRQLSVGERQKVEILKLLLADAQILILDEPTRSLAPHEIEGLFRVFSNLRRDGYAVVFITHKLKEVLACADRITVIRRGQVTGSLPGAGATENGLVALMFIGGGLAGLAGMAEVSAIHGQLRPSISPGYGYIGFLISWMAMGNAAGIMAAAFLLAIITAGGDILQMTLRIPGSVVNILMAIILFVILARKGGGR